MLLSRQYIRKKCCASVSVLLVFFVHFSGEVAAGWKPGSYDERFSHSKRGVVLEDNNVWVYTEKFRNRFGMPGRWVDEGLKGASAIAFRFERDAQSECGYFADSGNCRPIEYCVMDVYVTKEQGDKLPWKSNRPVGFVHTNDSTRFLSAKTEKDSRSWDESEQRIDVRKMYIGIDTMSWVSGEGINDKVYSSSSDGVRVLAYERSLYAGMDYLKLSLDCGITRQKHNVRIIFEDKFPQYEDFGYSAGVNGDADMKVIKNKYKSAVKEWFKKHMSGKVIHAIRLPDQYMAAINEYMTKDEDKIRLSNEVLKELNKK